MSALTWCSPELALHQLQRGEDRPLGAAGAQPRRAGVHGHRLDRDRSSAAAARQPAGLVLGRRRRAGPCAAPRGCTRRPSGSRSLPTSCVCRSCLAQHAGDALLDEVRAGLPPPAAPRACRRRSAAARHPPAGRRRSSRTAARGCGRRRRPAPSRSIARSSELYRPPCTTMPTSAAPSAKNSFSPRSCDEALRRGPALLDLLALVQEAGRRQHDAVDVAPRAWPAPRRWRRPGAGCPWR